MVVHNNLKYGRKRVMTFFSGAVLYIRQFYFL